MGNKYYNEGRKGRDLKNQKCRYSVCIIIDYQFSRSRPWLGWRKFRIETELKTY